ncbi:hypothetical protein FOZ62_032084 [Perkinsus olseni]|uniref:Uncharacterized protein n=1 Tax=Perkinsus olseni TaxID=32597 RepID=A0A7J6SU86_PEROL|nr:hypothetical protein FOZ62_032084 [Perkinsus olseni]
MSSPALRSIAAQTPGSSSESSGDEFTHRSDSELDDRDPSELKVGDTPRQEGGTPPQKGKAPEKRKVVLDDTKPSPLAGTSKARRMIELRKNAVKFSGGADEDVEEWLDKLDMCCNALKMALAHASSARLSSCGDIDRAIYYCS